MHLADRQRIQKLDQVISVRHAIHRVPAGPVKAKLSGREVPIKRVGCSGQCAGTKRTQIHPLPNVRKPLAVTAEHLKVGGHVMGKRDRLRLLKMRESRHEGLLVGLHHGEQRLQKMSEQSADFPDFVPDVHLHIQGDLVVPGTPCVQLLSGVADPVNQVCLHKAVDILISIREREPSVFDVLQNAGEPVHNLPHLVVCQDALLSEHRGVNDAAPDILPVESSVIWKGIIELLYQIILLFCESSAPKLCH